MTHIGKLGFDCLYIGPDPGSRLSRTPDRVVPVHLGFLVTLITLYGFQKA